MSLMENYLEGLKPEQRALVDQAMANLDAQMERWQTTVTTIGEQEANNVAAETACEAVLERERVLVRRALEVRAVVPDLIDEIVEEIETEWETDEDDGMLVITVAYPDELQALMVRREVHYRPGQAPV